MVNRIQKLKRRKFIKESLLFIPISIGIIKSKAATLINPFQNFASGGGTPTLKQSEEDNLTTMFWAHVSNDMEMAAASFRASSAYTMTRIDVLLQKTGTPTSTISCALLDATATPGDPGSTTLATASNTHTGSDISGATWLEFDFSNTSLSSGVDYYVRLSIPDNQSNTSNNYQWCVDNTGGGTNRMYRKETAAAWSGNDWASSINGGCVRVYGF